MMSDDELQAIDDWRFANRIATRSDAIRRLAKIGLATDDWIKLSEVNIDEALTTYIEHLQDGDIESRGANVVYRSLMFAWLDVLTVTRVAAMLRETGNMDEALAAAKKIRNEVWNIKIEELRQLNPIMDNDFLLKKNTDSAE